MKRKVKPEDIYKINLLDDCQISFDGKKVAYTKTYLDKESQKYISSIWVIENDTNKEYPYLAQAGSSQRPQWSHDGKKMAFVSDRSGEKQIWIFDSEKGEPYQLTTMKYGANYPIWGAKDECIFFISEAETNDSEEELICPMNQEEKQRREKDKKDKALYIKDIVHKFDGIGMLTDRKTHIWRVDINNPIPRRLTKWQHNFRDMNISDDGKYLTFISDPIKDLDFRPQHIHLWMIDVESEECKLLLDGSIFVEKPAFSKNADKIAFIGHEANYGWGITNKIYLLDLKTMSLTCLSKEFNRSIGDTGINDMRGGGTFRKLYWDYNNDEIYFLTSDIGNTHVFKINMEGKVTRVIGGERQIFSFSIDKDFNKAAICYTNPLLPNDIALYDLKTGNEERLIQVNKSYLEEVELSCPEEVKIKSFDGLEIQGWIIKPLKFESNKKYPAILEIHGGPQMMYSNSYMHEFQLLAANGYVVYYSNPRGSSGSTQEFMAGIRRENGGVGGGDYKDLMAGVDYLITLEYVDKERLGVTGGSYGGFMTNWIVGHTNRFKAAVTQRSISNWRSFVGSSDYGFCDAELAHQCDYYEDRDELERISPITYVKNIETPLLILHSEYDLRCPLEQVQQLFTELKLLRKTVEMKIFPNSSHGLSRNGRPVLRIERLNSIVDWFNKYLIF